MARETKNALGVKRFRRLVWQRYHSIGRYDMPWRKFPRSLPASRQAYRILISEVMLQQTQVSRVIPKYREFIAQFPDFRLLAHAPLRNVLRVWQGLGYNRRALYLKRIAERIIREFGGKLPHDPAVLRTFPGIGPNTAGSIAAFAFNKPVPFIETNIRRALLHHFFPHRVHVPDRALIAIAAACIPRGRAREWYYALMDYGAMLGAMLPKHANPNRRSKHYAKQPRFAGSIRELRGKALRLVLARGSVTARFASSAARDTRMAQVLRELAREGILYQSGARFTFAGW